jgi:hypothetical protein
MKTHLVALALAIIPASAWATQNVALLSCYYDHTEDGWVVDGAVYDNAPTNLAKDQATNINSTWTSDKPQGEEYALCNMATGTDDDDTLVITSYKYSATRFQPFDGKTCEDFKGTDVTLIATSKVTLSRGNSDEMLADDWLPPEPDKLDIRTYFAKADEIDHLADIWQSKCTELLPTN